MSEFTRNLVANVASHGGILLLQLFYTRILYQDLGPGLYGIVPLVTGMVFYLGLITASVSTSIRRHLTVAMATGDTDRAGLLLGVAIKSLMLLCVPLVVAGAFCIVRLTSLIDLPEGTGGSARFLATSVLLSFLIAQVAVPFGAATFAKNRLDIRGLISLAETFVRVAGVWILFRVSGPSLVSVGVSLCLSSLLALGATIVIQNRVIPGYMPRLTGAWDGEVFREMIRTGGWITVNLVGGILMLGIDLLVINRMLGATQAGCYAPILQLVAGFRGIGGILSSLFAPTLMSLHAKGAPSATSAYLTRSLRFFGILMALPVGTVCGLSGNLLHVWLGRDHHTSPALLVLMVGSLCVTLLEHPLNQVQLAANRVKAPALATLAAGALNAVLAIQLCRMSGVTGVALAGVIVLGAKTLLFTPAYNARILGTTPFEQLRSIGSSVAVFLLAFGWSLLAAKIFAPAHILSLGATGACSAAAACLTLYPIVLRSDERQVVDRNIVRFRGLVFKTAAP